MIRQSIISLPCSGLRRLRKILLGVLGLAVFLGFAQHAHADYSNAVFVEGTLTPTNIGAVGNSERYNQITPNGDITAKIRIKANAGVAGRVTEVNAWIHLRNLDRDAPDFSGQLWGYHKNYAGIRKRTIDSTVSVRIPAHKLKQWMTDQCNALVIQLRSHGLTERVIWGQDREIRIMASPYYGVGFTAPRGRPKAKEVQPPYPNLTLTCKRFAGAQGPGLGGLGSQEPIIRVESAILEHSLIAGHSGVCRLNLNYAVRTNLPNVQVRFRLKDDKGRSSEVKRLTTNDLKIATGSVSYNISQ